MTYVKINVLSYNQTNTAVDIKKPREREQPKNIW